MKELSIEEKAQRYDEALEKSKRLYEQGTITENLAYIFPELKESEDERIRGAILHFISHTPTVPKGLISKEDMIGWLEKQGESYTKRDVDDAYLKGIYDAKQELEKQGEQKPVEFKPSFRVGDVIKPKDTVLGEPRIIKGIHPKFGYGTNNGILDFEFEDNWELVEQKPIDKVEPKFNFKVSQWIVATGKCVYLIAKIDGFNVTLVDTNGDKYVFDASSLDDAHEWTIEDAKDGDVLATDNGGICIFDGTVEEGKYPFAYCGVIKRVFEICDGKLPFTHANVQPATREQRDTLEKAMADAGYTFDFEKKELKKIEQNHAWSEEDKEMIEDTCRILSNSKECTTSNVRWLKSLRPQSQWKPNDEQIKAIKWVMDGDSPENWNITLKNLYQDLKKLKS